MRSLPWAFGGALAALVVAVGAACGGGAFTAGPTDAGAGDGSLVDVGVDGGGDAGLSDAPGDAISVQGKTVFASTTTGDDTRTGLDPLKPKKTIVSGLAEAATLGKGAEVHVCAGNYAESLLVVNQDVALKGGYDCVTWLRSPTYGYPTFDTQHQSVITNGAPSKQEATLAVEGTLVTSATLIDGFSIVGGSSTVGTSFGVDVSGAASPTLTNDVVTGGSATAPNSLYGSVGVRIGGTSTGELSSCVVSGGSGDGPTGSVGVLVTSTGPASVHDDVVSGGTGVSTGASPALAAVGVSIQAPLDPKKGLSRMIVTGTDTAGVGGKSVGILVEGAGVAANIAGCEIEGGTGTDTATVSIGIDLETTGAVSVIADRIFGGTRKGSGSHTFGIHAGTAGTLSIVDSEIHAGEAVGGNGSSATGVSLETATAPSIVDDTIYSGAAMGSPAIELGGNVTAAIVSGNLLLGGGSASSDYAIVVAKCPGALASLDHTGFVNSPGLYECQMNNTFATDPGAMAILLGSSVASANVELLGTCAGTMSWCAPDPSCPSSPTTSCAQSIFGASFTSSDDGVGGLFDGPPAADGGSTLGAWRLSPGIPCALAHSGVVNSSVPTDLLGAPRGSMPSMGAVQYPQGAIPCEP
jgi:hypothetical protein